MGTAPPAARVFDPKGMKNAILAGKEKRVVYALVATVSLALVFTGFQVMKYYYQAPFTISDNIYRSTFFLAKSGATLCASDKVEEPQAKVVATVNISLD
ncbi:cytochrome c oxidase subunit 3, partial [Trifolium pratense]